MSDTTTTAKVIRYDTNCDGCVNDQSTLMDDIHLTDADLGVLATGDPASIIDWLSDYCGITVPPGTYIDESADFGACRIELVVCMGEPIGAIVWGDED